MRCPTCTTIEVQADRQIELLSRALDQALQMLPVQAIPQDLHSLYETWHHARHCASEQYEAVKAQRDILQHALGCISGEWPLNDGPKIGTAEQARSFASYTLEQIRDLASRASAKGAAALHKPNKPYKSPFTPVQQDLFQETA